MPEARPETNALRAMRPTKKTKCSESHLLCVALQIEKMCNEVLSESVGLCVATAPNHSSASLHQSVAQLVHQLQRLDHEKRVLKASCRMQSELLEPHASTTRVITGNDYYKHYQSNYKHYQSHYQLQPQGHLPPRLSLPTATAMTLWACRAPRPHPCRVLRATVTKKLPGIICPRLRQHIQVVDVLRIWETYKFFPTSLPTPQHVDDRQSNRNEWANHPSSNIDGLASAGCALRKQFCPERCSLH